MEKHTSGIVAIAAVLFLLVGFLFGGMYGSSEKTIEVPGETIYENTIVEKVVNVSVDSTPDYLGDAMAFFLEELEDEEDFERALRCDGQAYDFDDIEVSRVYDEYSLNFDDDELFVDFKVKLRYDEDDSSSCRNTFDVTVHYEEDEDTELILND